MNSASLIATLALVRDTFREAFARRIFWGFFVCSSLFLFALAFIFRIDFSAGPPMVHSFQGTLAVAIYYVGTALSVFASASLVSVMFEPGRIELLLSKPVSRTHLLLGRYLGNLAVVAANVSYLTGGAWLIFGLKTGVWGGGFLLSALCMIFVFAVLLAVIVLAAVVLDSAVVATMITFGILFAAAILAQRFSIERLLSSESSRQLVELLYYVLPKTSDISGIVWKLSVQEPVESWMPVWSSGLFGAAVLAAGIRHFQKRSF